MAKATELDEFVKKSSLGVKRISEHKVSLQGEFIFKSVRCEIKGQLDLDSGRLDSFQQDLTWGDKQIYQLTRSAGKRSSRSEWRFGKVTEGVRLLVLNNERLNRGSLVTGFADGQELVPYVTSGCHCSCKGGKDTAPHPLLAWGDASSTRSVNLKLSEKIGPELEGLATVIPRVLERMAGGGGLGDIGGCIDWIICYITCTAEQIWCILTSLPGPAPDIFIELCFVLYGDCFDWCTVIGTAP